MHEMKHFRLVVAESWHDASTDVFQIGSETELREHLARLMGGKPQIVELESPEPEHGWLRIAVGGPVGAVVWLRHPVNRFNAYLLSEAPVCSASVKFADGGDERTIPPDQLLPPSEVLDAAVGFFLTSALTCDHPWRVWDDDTKTWKTAAAGELLS
jgi:hypothetical protein